MNPIRMKKVSDENNVLGWDTIVLIDRKVIRVEKGVWKEDGQVIHCDHYVYSFLAICDGKLEKIDEADWESFDAYTIEDKGE